MKSKELDNLCVAAIRSTCIDTINKAKSGHPGMALGSAPILHVLFTRHLVSNPENPNWINRDRFILSAGHASALYYTMLHLGGYGLSIDDLKSFRQLDSKTPGHPEYKHTVGVDSTSGPFGQGIAQAVGMAMAERAVQAQYKDGNQLVDHYTYCLCGDGCLEEGLSQEAISLAGHHKLKKLILFYDSNKVTLDGSLDLSNSENARQRFIASSWNVLEVEDGNDLEAIDKAIIDAKKSDKPTLIIVQTVIGFGSAKQGTSKVHGSPLGEEDGLNAKKFYGYNYEPFYIPNEVYEYYKNTFISRGQLANKIYDDQFAKYQSQNKKEAEIFLDAINGNIEKYLPSEPTFEDNNCDSTRVSSGKALNELINHVPFLMGGSADVAGSVMTKINSENFSYEHPEGRNINYGIREFAMACVNNGMLLHGGLKVYGGCFLVFSDYMKSAIRMSCLSKIPNIYLFSHDSIAVGEDGPTHQPIEQLIMLRSIPNNSVIRPCDARETYGAWKLALLSKDVPTCLILSRQGLPLNKNSQYDISRGAYIISKKENAVGTILATGSEVSLAISAQELLEGEGIYVDVVSMPCVEYFEKQDKQYKDSVLRFGKAKTIAVEMLSTLGWYKYADTVMGIDTFGTSAPSKDAIKKFDFTKEHLAGVVKEVINK